MDGKWVDHWTGGYTVNFLPVIGLRDPEFSGNPSVRFAISRYYLIETLQPPLCVSSIK